MSMSGRNDDDEGVNAFPPSPLLPYPSFGSSVSAFISPTIAPGTEASKSITRTWENKKNDDKGTYHAWNYPENMQNTQDQPRPPITPETINQSVEFMKRLNAAANNPTGQELLSPERKTSLDKHAKWLNENPNSTPTPTLEYQVNYANFCAMQHEAVARYHRAHYEYFRIYSMDDLAVIAERNMRVAQKDADINFGIADQWHEKMVEKAPARSRSLEADLPSYDYSQVLENNLRRQMERSNAANAAMDRKAQEVALEAAQVREESQRIREEIARRKAASQRIREEIARRKAALESSALVRSSSISILRDVSPAQHTPGLILEGCAGETSDHRTFRGIVDATKSSVVAPGVGGPTPTPPRPKSPETGGPGGPGGPGGRGGGQ